MPGEQGKYCQALFRALMRAREASLSGPSSDRAEALALQLVSRPPWWQRQLLATEREAVSLEVTFSLLSRSRSLVHTDPRSALRAALVAVRSARACGLPYLSMACRADALAQAGAQVANCLRVLGRFRWARAAWEVSLGQLLHGTQDPHLAAECLRLRAHLHQAENEHAEAGLLLEQARSLLRSIDDQGAEGEVLYFLASLRYEAGNLEAAFRDLIQALSLVSAEASPGYALPMLHALVVFLNDAGLEPYALRVSRMLEPAYGLAGSELFKLRGFWLRGRLHASQHQWKRAERFLAQVREGFLARGLAYDASLASLDLALVYLEQNRPLRAAALANEMLSVFAAKEIPREVSATMILAGRAVAKMALSTQSLRQTIAELGDARDRKASI